MKGFVTETDQGEEQGKKGHNSLNTLIKFIHTLKLKEISKGLILPAY